jgi:phosphoribosyl 1,2-cyclic phosphodiesterase
MLVKYHNTPIVAPEGVAAALGKLIPEARRAITCVRAGAAFSIGGLSARSFPTMHDTPESVGYRFENGCVSFVIATDIGCVTQPVLDASRGADLAVIEANHDLIMLKNGAYPYYLKRRILSDRGHLSNDDSGRFASELARSGTRKIVLAHLSRDNNTPGLALGTVGGALARIGAAVGEDIQLAAAPPDDPGDIYIL